MYPLNIRYKKVIIILVLAIIIIYIPIKILLNCFQTNCDNAALSFEKDW